MTNKIGRSPASKSLMLRVFLESIPVENAFDYSRSIISALRAKKSINGLSNAHQYLKDYAVIRQSGSLFYINSHTILSSSIFIRAYEPEVYNEIKKSSGKLFVDVGAYAGAYSILTAKRFEKVISLEPNLESYSVLKKNIELNGLTNVIANRMAAAAINGNIVFYEGLFTSTYTALKDFILAKPDGQKLGVTGMRLDDLLAPYTQIDLVKIDVEGYEINVLEGMKGILPRVRKMIIEVDKENKSEVISILRGYKASVLEEGNISDNIVFKKLAR